MKRKKIADMTGEICVRCCEGCLEATRGREYFRYDQSLVIIEDVPAWVCKKCGERYHHAHVYKKMRQIAAHSDQLTEHVSIPVARYREGEAAGTSFLPSGRGNFQRIEDNTLPQKTPNALDPFRQLL